MATRRLDPIDWNTALPPDIQAQVARNAQAECVLGPSNSQRALRPRPLNIASKSPHAPLDGMAKLATSPKENSELAFESLQDPGLINAAPQDQWRNRQCPVMRARRMGSPSLASQCDARQSEISLGILDYYIHDRSPLPSPELPLPTPKLDPAIEQFDFGLPPTPTSTPAIVQAQTAHKGTKESPEPADRPLIPISPPVRSLKHNALNHGYSLFPAIKDVTPPPRKPAITLVEPITLRDITPPSTTGTISSPPDKSYRPRKESISSSVRSRNDSLISARRCSSKQATSTPLRIISSDSSTSPALNSSYRRTRMTSTATSSTFSGGSSSAQKTPPPPDYHSNSFSRWSDDTITSPSQVTTPGPRTSFGSLLRRDSAQYPACFFEDDDEESPLRRKFAWKKSSSGSSTMEQRRRGRYDEPAGFGSRVVRLMFCGCAGRR